jgi:hypothetical protein
MGMTADQQIQTPPTPPVTKQDNVGVIEFLSGKKTYTVAFLMVVYAASGYLVHQLTQDQAMTVVFNALAVSGLRSAINSLK